MPPLGSPSHRSRGREAGQRGDDDLTNHRRAISHAPQTNLEDQLAHVCRRWREKCTQLDPPRRCSSSSPSPTPPPPPPPHLSSKSPAARVPFESESRRVWWSRRDNVGRSRSAELELWTHTHTQVQGMTSVVICVGGLSTQLQKQKQCASQYLTTLQFETTVTKCLETTCFAVPCCGKFHGAIFSQIQSKRVKLSWMDVFTCVKLTSVKFYRVKFSWTEANLLKLQLYSILTTYITV